MSGQLGSGAKKPPRKGEELVIVVFGLRSSMNFKIRSFSLFSTRSEPENKHVDVVGGPSRLSASSSSSSDSDSSSSSSSSSSSDSSDSESG